MKKFFLVIMISVSIISTSCSKGEYIPVDAVITVVNSEDKLLTIMRDDGSTELINISKLSIDKELKEGMEIRIWLFDRYDDVSFVDEEEEAFPKKIEIITEN